MDRRTRRGLACALVGACLAWLGAVPVAHAVTYVYTDLSPFSLTPSWATYGGGTTFHISSTGDGTVSYRWLQSTDHQNDISANSCVDLASYGNHVFNAGVTDYRLLFSGSLGECFYIRGRTTDGSYMSTFDGRLQR